MRHLRHSEHDVCQADVACRSIANYKTGHGQIGGCGKLQNLLQPVSLGAGVLHGREHLIAAGAHKIDRLTSHREITGSIIKLKPTAIVRKGYEGKRVVVDIETESELRLNRTVSVDPVEMRAARNEMVRLAVHSRAEAQDILSFCAGAIKENAEKLHFSNAMHTQGLNRLRKKSE